MTSEVHELKTGQWFAEKTLGEFVDARRVCCEAVQTACARAGFCANA